MNLKPLLAALAVGCAGCGGVTGVQIRSQILTPVATTTTTTTTFPVTVTTAPIHFPGTTVAPPQTIVTVPSSVPADPEVCVVVGGFTVHTSLSEYRLWVAAGDHVGLCSLPRTIQGG